MIDNEGKVHYTFASITNSSSKKFISVLEKILD